MEHIETVIIGGGQAGLATGYALTRRHRRFVILEAHARLGDQWRRQYDSLRLYSPAKLNGLPGTGFPGDPDSFPGKDQVAEFIESYALRHELPVRTNTSVTALDRRDGGGFVVGLDGGELTCDNVVVATGKAGAPHVPEESKLLNASIMQVHSLAYKRPEQLPRGRVLVVGGSHSGTDIAYELAGTHEVTLCGRDPGQLPFRPEDRKATVLMPAMFWAWQHLLTRKTPIGRKMMPTIRQHGGPMVRVHREDLVAAGVERVTSRFAGVREGKPLLEDGTVVDAQAVVWATGFEHTYDWIRFPIAGDDGWPQEYRGVATDVPGLFFCGLVFQYAMSSMVFRGVGRDADYVAERIAKRVVSRSGTFASA